MRFECGLHVPAPGDVPHLESASQTSISRLQPKQPEQKGRSRNPLRSFTTGRKKRSRRRCRLKPSSPAVIVAGIEAAEIAIIPAQLLERSAHGRGLVGLPAVLDDCVDRGVRRFQGDRRFGSRRFGSRRRVRARKPSTTAAPNPTPSAVRRSRRPCLDSRPSFNCLVMSPTSLISNRLFAESSFMSCLPASNNRPTSLTTRRLLYSG